MENVRKDRDTRLVTTEKRRKCFVSEPNFHIKKVFQRKPISNRNETKLNT